MNHLPHNNPGADVPKNSQSQQHHDLQAFINISAPSQWTQPRANLEFIAQDLECEKLLTRTHFTITEIPTEACQSFKLVVHSVLHYLKLLDKKSRMFQKNFHIISART
jgi:hypothetical protein